MNVVEELFESPWLGPALWAAAYVSDFALTLTCAHMYRAQQIVVFEGSYELTPLFEGDVNALRKISPRFVASLIASTAYVWLVRRIAGPSTTMFDLYIGVLGAMLLVQATVHIRHLRNWFLFTWRAPFISGRLVYSRRFMLTMSAFELFLFACLYFGLFLVTASVFILGGMLACAVLSLNHYRLAQRHRTAPSTAA
jgi:hypothetical protein